MWAYSCTEKCQEETKVFIVVIIPLENGTRSSEYVTARCIGLENFSC